MHELRRLASVSLETGMPVHFVTIWAISSSSIDGRSRLSGRSHALLELRFPVPQVPLLVAQAAAFSNSCPSIAASFSRRVVRSRPRARGPRGGGHRLAAHARRGLVDQVDRLVGQEAAGDVAVGELAGGASPSVIVTRGALVAVP